MKIVEIRRMPVNDLHKQLASLREQLRTMRFKTYNKEVKNNHQMIEVRRDIARILTVLKEPRQEVK
jgi:ribosomal protein L29